MGRDDARLDAPPGGRPRERTFVPTKLESARPPIGLWLAATVMALGVAFLKPWAGEAPAQPLVDALAPVGGSSIEPGPTPLPTLRPDSAGPLVAQFCLDPFSWRVATIERWRDQTIRVWRAIDPIARATDPDDPAIPVFPISSEGVEELGWCAPVIGSERPQGVATIDAWRRLAAGPEALELTATRATGAGASFGSLYLPPALDDGAIWADGEYVFRHREATGRERWFAVDVELRPRTGPADPEGR